MPAQPADRLFGQVLAQMIFFIMRRLDGIEILDKPRLPLRRLAGKESIEVVEPDRFAGRPVCKRTHRGRFGGWGVVPLAECRTLVAVVAEHLRECCRGSRNKARVTIPVDRALGDGPRTDTMMIAAGQKRRAGRRADRGGVEGVVADAFTGDAAQGRRVRRTAVCIGLSEADIVEQDDDDVGRVLRQTIGLDAALMPGLLQRLRSDARRWHGRKRQDRAVIRRGRALGPGRERATAKQQKCRYA